MAGAGIAMSLLADEYNEKIVGRKRNLRNVRNIPGALQSGQGGEAFLSLLENVNRAGTFGLWGEVVNTAVNVAGGGGDNRTLSLDQRVVMMSSLLNTMRAIQAAIAQRDIEYMSVVRPMMMALGGNSALQYLQIGNNALGLDNAEARFMERVNVTNRLRVAGREMGLDVRTGVFAQSVPTKVSPEINRMILAAYAGDRADFVQHWRAAIQVAREEKEPDPVAYVRERFAGRHPLKSVFASLGEGEYAKMLRYLDDRGRDEVKEAVGRFNAYAGSLGAKPYYGSQNLRRQERGAMRDGLLGF
jgi:hypothetical protein